MIEEYDFVIFLSEDWVTFFRRHLIRSFAGQLHRSRVLCVERPVCPLITPFKKPVKFVKWITGQGNLWKEKENLAILRPFISLHDHVAAKLPLLPWINRKLLGWQLYRAVETLGLRRDHLIMWIYDPFQEEYLGLLSERLLVYECYDEYTTWAGVPFFRTQGDLVARETRILGRADVTFVVSKALYERKRLFSPNVHVIPNAVDAQHFGLARDRNTKIADDVAGISHPVIGYLGNLTERIDFALLSELARTRPEWSLVLVGGAKTPLRNNTNRQAIAELKHMKNVHFLGSKSYEELPSYLKAFDVCLIPYFAEDPFNIHCSPLKLFEYLATGKPIVSTDLPGVKPFDGLVRIARDGVEFEKQVVESLNEQGETMCQQRLAIARENSWEKRVEQIITVITEHL